MRVGLIAALTLVLQACTASAPAPAQVDVRHDACAECRMTVSNIRFASQLVAPGEEPRVFDDIGCLAAYLRDHAVLPANTLAYVADHRTGEWVTASSAVFTRAPGIETPMGSHVVAHASAGSRDADARVRGGAAVAAAEFFPRPLPGGDR